jgi:hypothetical protein
MLLMSTSVPAHRLRRSMTFLQLSFPLMRATRHIRASAPDKGSSQLHRRPPGGSPYGTEEYHGLRRKDSIKFANCGFFLGTAPAVCRGFVMFDEVWCLHSCGGHLGLAFAWLCQTWRSRLRESRPGDRRWRPRAVLDRPSAGYEDTPGRSTSTSPMPGVVWRPDRRTNLTAA